MIFEVNTAILAIILPVVVAAMVYIGMLIWKLSGAIRDIKNIADAVSHIRISNERENQNVHKRIDNVVHETNDRFVHLDNKIDAHIQNSAEHCRKK
jgi:uncharacterized protein YybS (DUF2232 family)